MSGVSRFLTLAWKAEALTKVGIFHTMETKQKGVVLMGQEKWDFPKLDYYINDGIHTGSRLLSDKRDYSQEMRYRIFREDDHLHVFIWRGPYSFEKSEMLFQNDFPLDNDGLQAAHDWIISQYEKLKAGWTSD